ncbi:MAG: glycosyltransferase family 4 protein [Planctomycetes bacterium]|nr:glycosyltransferase family 4 protein [Planctomycetota bacterium]
MKILYHHRTAADDGQAVHIRELQSAFRRLGHEVREVALVTRSKPGQAHQRSMLGTLADWAPRFVRELAEHGYDLVGARALRSAIAEQRPDLLYERYALSTACGATVARELKIPYVLEVNSPLVDEVSRTRGLSFAGIARRKELKVLRTATLVAVVSGALRDWVLSCGVERSRIVLTPNGVDRERFAPRPKSAELLQRLDLAGKVVIGFTGFVRDWHRLDLALDAIAKARLATRGAVLLVVGEGPALEGLRKHAEALGLSDAVHFTGKVDHKDMADYVRLIDIALVTAINPYASPLKLFEYLAVGAASVVVDQPNLREIVDEQAARFFPQGDAEALARSLEELVLDPAVRTAIGQSGRALLLERDYTWDGNVRRVISALKKATFP